MNPSAAPASLCHLRETFTPASRLYQAGRGSVFPRADAATVQARTVFQTVAPLLPQRNSGFSPQAVNDPDTGYRPRGSVYVTQFLPLVRKLSSLALFIPSAGGVMPRPFFISFGIDEVTRS